MTAEAPRVSVVMATYNHAPFVEEAMESVLSQQGVEFEFLILPMPMPAHTAQRGTSRMWSLINF